MKGNNSYAIISKQTMQRLPYYLSCLNQIQDQGEPTVSATTLAGKLDLNDVLVRKDLAAVSSHAGRPRTGFVVKDLIHDIEACLGGEMVDCAILVGAGHLGKALLSYKGFETYSLEIVAAFDKDEFLIGTDVLGKRILPMSNMEEFCRENNIKIGIVVVPGPQAQMVCDYMVKCGIKAIWNFAPVHLSVPKDVLLKNENIATSLAYLCKQLKEMQMKDVM